MQLRVLTDFATGNGVVQHTASGIRLDRDIRDSTGDRWYWHIRLATPTGTRLRVEMARQSLLAECGPTVSYGDGYQWLDTSTVHDKSFEVVVPAGVTVSLCPTFPYGQDDWVSFGLQLPKLVGTFPLATSEVTRSIPAVRVAARETARATLLLTARHHACEAMGSFVLEGAVREFVTLASNGDPVAARSDLIAVPMVDVDGVFAGDQGKCRMPWDHGRDYGERSIYAGVKSLRCFVESHLNRAVFALDFHTPGLRGTIEQVPYIVSSGDTEDLATAGSLLQALNGSADNLERTAELLVMDAAWNSRGESGQRSCTAWLRSRSSTRTALIVEYPNALVRGVPVTPSAARAFGAEVLRALVSVMR